MKIITIISELKSYRASQQGRVGFVPTMGALHAGHLSLVEAAQKTCDQVIVSIFVNPLQFGAHEDLSRYPRPFEQDVALLEKAGVNAVFSPSPEMLYPEGFATHISITNGMDKVLCGAHRAGHFAGVCTVVALLFSLTRPHIAFFGEKDFQQLTILKQLNRDLHLVEDIIGVPTMREVDGLALSSRNRYLTPQERAIAPALYATLCEVKNTLYHIEENSIASHLSLAQKTLLDRGFTKIDYLQMRDATSLSPTSATKNARLFAALYLGNTRLIDNIAL